MVQPELALLATVFSAPPLVQRLSSTRISKFVPGRRKPGSWASVASIRQLIESGNDTLKGQLDLELHGGRSLLGVTTRVAQRLLALTAAIWHNRATGQPKTRSLIA
jgi:hypothetical protein